MARTKADLIADAEAKGIVLTGDETTGDLKALLEAHGETEAEAEGLEPTKLDPTKSIFVDLDASGNYLLMDAPEGYMDNDRRRLTIEGVNVEHTDDGVDGVWCYRKM